jgi:hypothetical protein
LKNPLDNNYPIGDPLYDKFANLSEDMTWVKGASGWLKSLPSSRAHTRTTAKKRVYPKTYSYMRIRYALHKRLSLIAGSPIVNTTTMMRKSSKTKVGMTHGGRTTTSLRVMT